MKRKASSIVKITVIAVSSLILLYILLSFIDVNIHHTASPEKISPYNFFDIIINLRKEFNP